MLILGIENNFLGEKMNTKNIGRKSVAQLVAALVVGSFLIGCEEGDDQTVVPKDRAGYSNPALTPRDFVKNNLNHKILMAVIDSGVDYNHPALKDHMHFDLDKNGSPVGLGYDFVGKDHWPAPYLAMSVDQNKEAPAEEKAKAQNFALHMREILALPAAAKGVSTKIEVGRRLDQELDSGAFHGTHVAGLMTYDNAQIGLIPYRVLPRNIQFKAGQRVQGDPEGEIVNSIMASIEDAAKHGVRVINMSLALTGQRSPKGDKDQQFADFKVKLAKIAAVVKAHPEIAFVAAAGNEGAWIDARARLQLPCGIDAQNVLCVGALDNSGGIASFSNIVLRKVPYILSPGEDVISTFPTKMCSPIEGMGMMSPYSLLSADPKQYPWTDKQTADEIRQMIVESCKSSNGFIKLSGTSMASPVASRMVAEVMLKYPKMTGAQAIARLLETAGEYQEGPLTLKKLKVAKPSWYKSQEVNEGFSSQDQQYSTGSAQSQSDSFEFSFSK